MENQSFVRKDPINLTVVIIQCHKFLRIGWHVSVSSVIIKSNVTCYEFHLLSFKITKKRIPFFSPCAIHI